MTDWTARVHTALIDVEHPPDDDVLEELGQHLEMLFERALRGGMTAEEAERLAAAQLAAWRQQSATLRRPPRRLPAPVPPPAGSYGWTGLMRDVGYATRLLRRHPRYAVLVAVTIALGVGASTALADVAYAVLMKPLPWPAAERLVVISESRGGRPPRFGSISNAAYLAWRDSSSTVEGLAAWTRQTMTFTDGGEPERMHVVRASASLFDVLGAEPLVGASFTPHHELSGDVVLISESVWRNRYGAEVTALNRVVQLDGRSYRVIGVIPDARAFPDREVRAWVPLLVTPPEGDSLSMFDAVARLSPGVTAGQAAAEASARGRFAAATDMTAMAIFGGPGPIEIATQPLRDAFTGDVRRPLLMLLAAVGLLMVTATANVLGLQLARATTRRRELAIRAALGANAGWVTRQLVVESLLPGLAGGAGGVALAAVLHHVMPFVLPVGFPRADEIALSVGSVAFAIVVSVAASIVVGIVPALRVVRLDLVQSLAEDGLAPVGAGSRSRTAQARALIMVGQVAIACVLLVGAVLLARSFHALLAADRGYDPSGVLTARLSLPDVLYNPARRYTIVDGILARLGALPGVDRAAFTSELPLTPGGSTTAFTFRSRDGDGGVVSGRASPRIVSPGYFRALGVRIVAGRGFAESAGEASEAAVIVNRAFASRYLGASPLDTRMPVVAYQGAATGEASVAGVAEDVRYPAAADSGQPEIYYSHRLFDGHLSVPVVTLLVRTAGDPAALAPALRTIVRGADPTLVPEAIATMEQRMLRTLAQPRLYAAVLGMFASAAVILAAIGLFGVLSYLVAQRSRELAVRLALGASPAAVARLVVGQGLAVTGAGLAIGLLCSLAMTRWLATLLYGVSVRDGVTFAVVPAALVLVAAAACLGPALGAARVDPLRALRE